MRTILMDYGRVQKLPPENQESFCPEACLSFAQKHVESSLRNLEMLKT